MDNKNNRLITIQEVESILNRFEQIGDNKTPLKIRNLEHYQKSFVHESYHQSQLQNSLDEKDIVFPYLSKESNERLEYLGDHILKSILGKYLYQRFPTEREGFLTRLKIKLEKRETLANFAILLGFRKYLLLSSQVESQTFSSGGVGRDKQAYYEDAFESFLGAIVEDFGEYGFIYAERFVRSILENVIDFSKLISTNDNFKDSIQRFFQTRKWSTPVYVPIQTNNIAKDIFVRGIFITKSQFDTLDKSIQYNIIAYSKYHKVNYGDRYLLACGMGRKFVIAEQNAAKEALKMLNLNLNY